jgi:hypothetical protein
MEWKIRAIRSCIITAACTLFVLASPPDRAQVAPESGAGVLLAVDDDGHSVASPVGWSVDLVGRLRTVIGAPFSGVATTQSTSQATDGRRFVHTTTTRYYRDGVGRLRIERDSGTNDGGSTGSTPWAHSALVIDRTRSQRGMMYALKRTAYVLTDCWPIAAPSLRPPIATPDVDISYSLPGHGPQPIDAAGETVALGKKEIDGLEVVGSRRVHVVRVGEVGNGMPITITAEQWFSPELGVVVIHSEARRIGNRTDEMTSRLHQVVRAEPDHALLTIPGDYSRIEVACQILPPGRISNSGWNQSGKSGSVARQRGALNTSICRASAPQWHRRRVRDAGLESPRVPLQPSTAGAPSGRSRCWRNLRSSRFSAMSSFGSIPERARSASPRQRLFARNSRPRRVSDT